MAAIVVLTRDTIPEAPANPDHADTIPQESTGNHMGGEDEQQEEEDVVQQPLQPQVVAEQPAAAAAEQPAAPQSQMNKNISVSAHPWALELTVPTPAALEGKDALASCMLHKTALRL